MVKLYRENGTEILGNLFKKNHKNFCILNGMYYICVNKSINVMNRNTISKVWNVVESKFQREFNVRETLSLVTYNKIIWFSWGVNLNTVKNLSDKCLLFKVNGRKFKGFVCVTLGWEDLYQVHLVSNDYQLKESMEGIFFDELVKRIDDRIESVM